MKTHNPLFLLDVNKKEISRETMAYKSYKLGGCFLGWLIIVINVTGLRIT